MAVTDATLIDWTLRLMLWLSFGVFVAIALAVVATAVTAVVAGCLWAYDKAVHRG